MKMDITRLGILGVGKDHISSFLVEHRSIVGLHMKSRSHVLTSAVIKSGGYKISALDIEREILALDYISEVSVMGIADEDFGQRVAAVVVLRDVQQTLSLVKLRNDLRETLSGYKLPTALYVAPELAKTASGKIQKKALRTEIFDSGRYEDVIQRYASKSSGIRAKL
jgi:acyl-CoA synthetase (AMP-forming)/AMP-acid ligase II